MHILFRCSAANYPAKFNILLECISVSQTGRKTARAESGDYLQDEGRYTFDPKRLLRFAPPTAHSSHRVLSNSIQPETKGALCVCVYDWLPLLLLTCLLKDNLNTLEQPITASPIIRPGLQKITLYKCIRNLKKFELSITLILIELFSNNYFEITKLFFNLKSGVKFYIIWHRNNCVGVSKFRSWEIIGFSSQNATVPGAALINIFFEFLIYRILNGL